MSPWVDLTMSCDSWDSNGAFLSLLCLFSLSPPPPLRLLAAWRLTRSLSVRSLAFLPSIAPFDIVPIPEPGDHLNPVLCYLGPEGASKYLTHPYASPLFGDFRGLPPMLVQSGEAEVLRDEITLMAHKATLQGVKVMCVYPCLSPSPPPRSLPPLRSSPLLLALMVYETDSAFVLVLWLLFDQARGV